SLSGVGWPCRLGALSVDGARGCFRWSDPASAGPGGVSSFGVDALGVGNAATAPEQAVFVTFELDRREAVVPGFLDCLRDAPDVDVTVADNRAAQVAPALATEPAFAGIAVG